MILSYFTICPLHGSWKKSNMVMKQLILASSWHWRTSLMALTSFVHGSRSWNPCTFITISSNIPFLPSISHIMYYHQLDLSFNISQLIQLFIQNLSTRHFKGDLHLHSNHPTLNYKSWANHPHRTHFLYSVTCGINFPHLTTHLFHSRERFLLVQN